METLLLDFYCLPIGRLSWQRAVTQYFKGRVEVLAEYETRDIRSATVSMKMPAVVRELTRYKKKNAVKFSRENVYIRDRGRCQYCGVLVSRTRATYDHVVPRDHGGKTKWDNIVIACFMCNQRKRNRTPEQSGMRLLVEPIRPKSLPSTMKMTFTWLNGMPDEWRVYLGASLHWQADPGDGPGSQSGG